jgi:hypothetical protein
VAEAGYARPFRANRQKSLPSHCMKLVGVLLAIMLSGCGGEKSKFPTATVQGSVTIDGAAVKEGSIQFMPEGGVSGQPCQATIANGQYVAKNAPVGKVRALFTITRPTGKMITEYSSTYPEIENLVPEQYRSGVPITVSGNDNIPFDLKTASESDQKQ